MRIGMLTHGLPPRELGGAEAHSAALASALAHAGHEVFILSGTRGDELIKEEQGERYQVQRLGPQPAARRYRDIWDRPGFLQQLEDWLDACVPDVVHLGHPTGLSLLAGGALGDRKIPYGITLHDYWAWCSQGQMLRPDGIRCTKADPRVCAACQGHVARLDDIHPTLVHAAELMPDRLKRRISNQLSATDIRPADEEDPATRRVTERILAASKLLSGAAFVHCPSRFMADRVAEQFGPDIEVRFLSQPFRGRRPPPERPPESPLRVAFLGTLLKSKGVETILEAASATRDSVRIDLIGPWPAPPQGLSHDELEARASRAGVRLLGPRRPRAIPALLRGYEVLILPSVWHENAPLVLREGAEAGLALVGTSVGGMEEFLRQVDGMVIPPGDPNALASALNRLADEPGLLARHRRAHPSSPTPADVWKTLETWLVACVENAGGLGSGTPSS